MATPDHERFRAYLEREMAQARANLARDAAQVRATVERELSRKHGIGIALGDLGIGGFAGRDLEPVIRRNSKRRPPGMAPALVEPPRGPVPLQGGAAAPLEFGD
jgi:predicted nucleic acid-binding protein